MTETVVVPVDTLVIVVTDLLVVDDLEEVFVEDWVAGLQAGRFMVEPVFLPT